MHGDEMRRIRKALGLDRIAFAKVIGYTGTDRNNETRLSVYENGRKQIPLYIARMCWMLLLHHDLTGQLPHFPDWPGYEFSHEPDPQHQKAHVDG